MIIFLKLKQTSVQSICCAWDKHIDPTIQSFIMVKSNSVLPVHRDHDMRSRSWRTPVQHEQTELMRGCKQYRVWTEQNKNTTAGHSDEKIHILMQVGRCAKVWSGKPDQRRKKLQLQSKGLNFTPCSSWKWGVEGEGGRWISHKQSQQSPLLGGSGGVVNSLYFCSASLKSLGCFYFRCVLSSQLKAVTINLWSLQSQL